MGCKESHAHRGRKRLAHRARHGQWATRNRTRTADASVSRTARDMDNGPPGTVGRIPPSPPAEKILTLKGKDLNAFPGVTCRLCGSGFVAALTYTMIREHAEIENALLAETASQNPLVLKTNYIIKSGDSRNAFICLQCGMEFGL